MEMTLFKIRGIRVEIHYSFAVLFFAFVYLLMPIWIFNGNHPLWNFSLSVLFTIILFAGIFMHELAHAIEMLKAGFKVDKISFFLLGAGAHTKDYFKTPNEEIRTASAGILVSIVLSAIWFGLYFLTKTVYGLELYNSNISAFFFFQYLINLYIVIINVLPLFPTDGGRILKALIWKKTENLVKATTWATHGSCPISLAIILSFPTKYGSIWYSLVGIFLIIGSYLELEHVKTGKEVGMKDMLKLIKEKLTRR